LTVFFVKSPRRSGPGPGAAQFVLAGDFPRSGCGRWAGSMGKKPVTGCRQIRPRRETVDPVWPRVAKADPKKTAPVCR